MDTASRVPSPPVVLLRAVWLCVLLTSCGGDGERPVQGPSPIVEVGCGLGPFASRRDPRGVECDTSRGCPLVQPVGAVSVFAAKSCTYLPEAGSCSPVPVALCHAERYNVSALFARPPGGLCGAEVSLLAYQLGDDGVVEWTATELAPTLSGCRPVGQPLSGRRTLRACCETTIDITMSENPFTVRLVVERDWVR